MKITFSLRLILFVVSLFSSFSVYATKVVLHDTQLSTLLDKTRLVLFFNGPIRYQLTTNNNQKRIVIDCGPTQLRTRLDDFPLWSGPIQNIRSKMTANHHLQIIVDMRNKLLRTQPTIDHKKGSFALVVDIFAENTQVKPKHVLRSVANKKVKSIPRTNPPIQNPSELTKEDSHPPQDQSQESTPPPGPNQFKSKFFLETSNEEEIGPHFSSDNMPKQGHQRDVVVVIDPGHGGKDPGAMGRNSGREKEVVLGISKALQHELNQVPGVHAVLTRSGDYYIPLRERLRIARRDKGDFFIAIHADAYPQAYARGASVFALSEHGATSEAARWLAEKENYSELGGVALTNKSRLLRSVLLDLSQTATINQSMAGGHSILVALSHVTDLHRGFMEQAPFMVLKSPDIPSLLVETGFITNPFEERRLRDTSYQRHLAQAITVGIKNHFWSYPPPGSFIAQLKHRNKVI